MPTDLPVPNWPVSFLSKLIGVLARWRRSKQPSVENEGLSDRLLADIGLPQCLLLAGLPEVD